MLDVDADGEITKEELKAVIHQIAKLFNYKIKKDDIAQMEFLWSMMDVNKDGKLSQSEVGKVLTKSPLTKEINNFAQTELIKAVQKIKAKDQY